MDRGVWRATAPGSHKVGHDRGTEPTKNMSYVGLAPVGEDLLQKRHVSKDGSPALKTSQGNTEVLERCFIPLLIYECILNIIKSSIYRD